MRFVIRRDFINIKVQAQYWSVRQQRFTEDIVEATVYDTRSEANEKASEIRVWASFGARISVREK